MSDKKVRLTEHATAARLHREQLAEVQAELRKVKSEKARLEALRAREESEAGRTRRIWNEPRLGSTALEYLGQLAQAAAEHADGSTLAADAWSDVTALRKQLDRLEAAARFSIEQLQPLPMLWEKSLSSPERKYNAARAAVLLNLGGALGEPKEVQS